MTITALIADDEPVLRSHLEGQLAKAWPELRVVAKARNGREAVELFDRFHPAICFLDVHMPGMSGIEAARLIGVKAHLVFVTAYDHFALEAFEHGVLDYLVKPVSAARLAATVSRLKDRIRTTIPSAQGDEALRELARRLDRIGDLALPDRLRWIRATKGGSLHLIPVGDVDYLRADTKYTRVAYRDDHGESAEVLVRMPLKDMSAKLDPDVFVQVHRGIVVNLNAVRRIHREDRESAEIELKFRPERLPVSRTFMSLFREM